MKKLLIIFIITALAACEADKLEIPKAKKVVEDLIVAIDKGNYAEVSNYYSPNFNQSEPVEERNKKLDALKKAMGDLKSYQLIDSLNAGDAGDESVIKLTYKIQHTKMTSIETFKVEYEEGGYRISGHDVKSDNM